MTDKGRPNVKVISAIICDDVRKEDNGKEILIGVYSGSILIPRIPTEKTFRVWVNLKAVGFGNATLMFRGSDHKKNTLFQGTLDMKVPEINDETGLSLPAFGALFEDDEGFIKIDYKKDGGRWSNIIKKRVLHHSGPLDK